MNKIRYVILIGALAGIFLTAGATVGRAGQSDLEKRVDSLFVVASSGEVTHLHMVEPAIEALVQMGEEAVPRLIAKFDTKSARERVTLMNILRQIGSPAVPYLLRALKRGDDLIVQRVCGSLGEIKDSSAVDGLMAVCNHENWQVRDQAVGSLGKIGDRQAAPAVAAALNDSIGQVRKSAAVAAGRLELQTQAGKLISMLGDDFYGARYSAFDALLKLDTALVIEQLADSLGSANNFVGDLGCDLLGELGTDRAMDLLVGQLTSPDPDRRAHAAVAMIKADPLDNCRYRRFFDNETDRFVLLKIKSAIAAVQDESQ